MTLMRWEPFRELITLREAMDRLFDEAFTRPLSLFEGWGSLPLVDMYQTDNEVVVKATLPGVKPEDLQITVTGDVLTIKGEVKQEEEVKNATYHLRERRYGTFARSIPLPVPVVADKAHAEFENGILTLTLPKAEEVRPKTITVKAK
ncbi:Hsp20/alpha crystallin family protein [Candidatus Parcubacteria bacterium]|nr:MAG: Hsp20/alpha crystallin family protein [Candidatus Parcubacteria bacterium]